MPMALSHELISQFVLDNNVSESELSQLLGFIETGAASQYAGYTHVPVDPATFFTSREFMGAGNVLYPVVLHNLIEFNSGKYVEGVLTGGIGSGKTTLALYTTAYQLYLLSCIRDPHAQFKLDPSSEIILIFQSITAGLAKMVSYNRFREMISTSPYFSTHFPFRMDLESKMVFPNRIEVVPVSGSDTAAIGQNVVGGVIDELNYMAVVEKSKRGADGGTYNQAVSVYNSIARRRKSRFLSGDNLPGLLCLVSSRRYPGEFTDTKEQEALTDPTIFVYDKCVWEIKPEGTYSGEYFHVFVGDQTRQPRIIEKDELVNQSDRHLLKEVPEVYREDFRRDIINSLREIAGVATQALHPFIMDIESVASCFKKAHPSVLSSEWADFDALGVKILASRMRDLEEPRFVHIDLGLTSDSAGVACGYISGFQEISRGDHVEIMPVVKYDFVLEVRPPKGGEIKFFKIRDLLYKLRDLGLPIHWVSYDSWQSVDSLQILRQRGFMTGVRSLDATYLPYQTFKTALYDQRLTFPPHSRLQSEIVSLEQDPKTGKVDHPPHGSKDCSDAAAGVYFGLVSRRSLWLRYNIMPTQIPAFLAKDKDPMKKEGS